MTPRHEVERVDAGDPRDEVLKALRTYEHAQVVVSRGEVDEIVGLVRKQDLLDQVLDGKDIDIAAAIQPPIIVHESMTVLAVLETFQSQPMRMAVVATSTAASRASSRRPTSWRRSRATCRRRARSLTWSSARTALFSSSA